MAEAEKKPEAAPAPAATAASSKVDGSKIIGNLLIATIMLTVIASSFIFVGMGYVAAILVIGILPGVAARMVDRRPGKYASKTVMAFNVAGLMPHMSAMFYSSNPNDVAMSLFNDPMTWMWIYMFAAFGWLVIHLLPQISFLIFSMKAEYTIKKIKKFREMLAKEWGEEITK